MRYNLQFPNRAAKYIENWLGDGRFSDFGLLAEEAGFDGVSVYDHPFPADAWLEVGGHVSFDPFVSLAVIAERTKRIRLLTNILVLPYRSPFVTAQALATLDRLSGGRATAGVAAGYLEAEFQVLGAPFEVAVRASTTRSPRCARRGPVSPSIATESSRRTGTPCTRRRSNSPCRSGSVGTAAGQCGGQSRSATVGCRSPKTKRRRRSARRRRSRRSISCASEPPRSKGDVRTWVVGPSTSVSPRSARRRTGVKRPSRSNRTWRRTKTPASPGSPSWPRRVASISSATT